MRERPAAGTFINDQDADRLTDPLLAFHAILKRLSQDSRDGGSATWTTRRFVGLTRFHEQRHT
jgi:hypothetical protein